MKDKALGILVLIFVGGLAGLGIWAWRRSRPPDVQVSTPLPGVQVVTIEKPVLTEKVIRQVVKDPADQAMIQSLLTQLKAAQAEAKTVTVAKVESTSTGEGKVTQVHVPETSAPGYHFEDWRLTFDTDLTTARYTLTQRFEVVSTTGRRKNGSPLALAKVFELGPGVERRELQTVDTTFLVADETAPHWMLGLTLQAGLGVARNDQGARETLGVGAVQWLKHGRTAAAEDSTYAILSPAVVFGSGVQDVGVLPVSLNLGRVPHQPFKDLWVSPFVSRSRAGGFVTASF